MRIELEEGEVVARKLEGKWFGEKAIAYELKTSATQYTFFQFKQLVEALRALLGIDESEETDSSLIFKGG